jgi:hypothetical protein
MSMNRGASAALIALSTLLGAASAAAHEPDPRRLPLGDSRVSNAPRQGWIWACRVDPGAGGAHRPGPWIRGDGTFDITAKAVVPGEARWPHRVSIRREGDRRVIETHGLPDHGTGTFPIPPSSEAYRYDRNPNVIRRQDIRIALPAAPRLAPAPTCAPGAVGILFNGVVLFSALDAPGRDAVAHETQDHCHGHPQRTGVYHYHSLSPCIPDPKGPDGHSRLVGYAIDGFGIFGHHGVGGKRLSSADLDECHGHAHEIEWDGKRVVMYHYHATADFPYTVGCLKGTYDRAVVRAISGPPPGGPGGPGGGPGGPGGPPPGGPPPRR